MTHAPSAAADRLPLSRLLAFSLGSIPAYLIIAMTGVYLPAFYAGKMGVTLTVVGATIGILRLVDLGVDLGLGWLMDQTRTPIGRYRPWYLAGLPVLWLSVYKVFNPPEGVDTTYLFGWYLLLYVAYSMLVLGHSAWAAMISRDYHDRSRVFGWILGMAVTASATLQALPLLTPNRIRPADPASIPTIGWIIAVASTVFVLITAFSAPETEAPVAKKEKVALKDYFAVFTNPSMVRIIL